MQGIKNINGLVNVCDIDDGFIIDLRYAKENNFTRKKIYPAEVCVLQEETALKLSRANRDFKELGLKIKVWDAYRPIYVQRIFWDMVRDDRFVANPNKNASRHNRGTAVDITLVKENGEELRMPSEFDDFSEKAYRNYKFMSSEERDNLNLMTEIMLSNGFLIIDTEWWHFEDDAYKKYDIYNIDLDQFIRVKK
ncbi:M15 family metallopeptidase [Clostridium sp. 19966]|uniref:M15 family metallopeptidase n=1 Tax=Clostridium sp. 19966 TaxID=2768166 RepID=UPI0028DD8D23|nr:M15 family metallopeptidase [Clostridium sp. 19966]MDT8719612.1 M15 family metallopeptidase [Clostridium sp. 19966]